MARYLVFTDLTGAQARNAAEAAARFCDDATTAWWETIEHPASGQAALIIQDTPPYDAAADQRGVGGLSPDEIASLQPQSAMDAGGWFTTQAGD